MPTGDRNTDQERIGAVEEVGNCVFEDIGIQDPRHERRPISSRSRGTSAGFTPSRRDASRSELSPLPREARSVSVKRRLFLTGTLK